jgi:diguanylate cyclase (GGDEF) domain
MKRLRYKLSAALLPVVILPLLALGFQGMLQLNNSSQENLRSQVALIASNSHLQLNDEVRNYRLNLLSLTESDSLMHYLTSQDLREKENYHTPRVLRMFHQLLAQNPGMEQISLLDANENEVLKTGKNIDPFSQISPSNRQFMDLLQQQSGRFYERFILDPDLEQFVLKIGLRFNSYHPALSRYDRPPAQYTLLLTTSLYQLGDYLKEQERLYGFKLQLIEKQNHQLIFTTDPSLLDNTQEEAQRPQERLINGYHLERSPLNDDLELVAWIPEKTVASASAKIRTSLIAWLLLSLAILLLLSSWILKRLIISPMERLRSLMRQVARQEIHHIPMLPVIDEMTELHNQFSSMLNRLEISQHELEQSAYTDPVTGLENRIAFLKLLHKQLQQSRAVQQPFSLILIKMHNLSSINNTFGTRTGDLALLAMTRLLLGLNNHQAEGAACHLARIGSDEFTFLLPPDHPAQAEPSRLCAQLARELESPLLIGDYQLRLRFSAGLVSYPDAGEQVEELMQSLSQARHQAGRYTGSYWYQLDGASATRLRENKWLESELGHAIERNQLSVVFQPQYTMQDRRICGAEVLLRWNHPDVGMVPPDRFIPIAEHSSQILELDLWVLEQSCQFLAKLQQSGWSHIHIAVNASATELSNPCYPEQVTELLARYKIPATSLGIEITETALVELDEVAHDMVKKFKELGIEISLDDFGTGYTSLKHLAELPLDILKIDRSFTQQIEEDTTMIDSIVQLANAFHLQLIAEGVETESQYDKLHQRGCQMAQGYLLSRPVDGNMFWQLLSEQAMVTTTLPEQTPSP